MPATIPPPAVHPIPKRSFLILTPCDDGHKLCFWDSVREFEKLYYGGNLNTPHTFHFHTVPGDSLVPRARNNLAHLFRAKTNFDYAFPLDSDLDFRHEDILHIADAAASRDLDFVSGLYAIKQNELRWCLNNIEGIEADPATGLQEIACAPGGIHCVHRRVFDAMIAAAPTWRHWRVKYDDDHDRSERYDFYFNGVVFDKEFFPSFPNGRYLSEDWGFSYFARKLGFKVWCDTVTVMLHRGETFYPLQARRETLAESQQKKIETV